MNSSNARERQAKERKERMGTVMKRLFALGLKTPDQLVPVCIPFAEQIYQDTAIATVGIGGMTEHREDAILEMIEDAYKNLHV